uniref:Filamin binding LIM protein 1 n=1 Tax=Dicentrarchus labrax TaxID=13489 RepID=A0A8C4EK92_DICLA
MASAAPPKRMVSSFFITLASPHRATVTQQQPALQAHSTPARDKQHAAARISPSDNTPALRHKKEDHSQPESYGSVDSKGWAHGGASAPASDPQSPKPVCGFCRKPVALSEPAIEALNRTYHDGCFQCRSCHIPLAGKQYYNKAGIPLCEDCYQASLELCWACGEAITDHVIRALERAYHLSCFTCATCKQQIGEQAFAQGEVGEVYCLQDYYRKYAPKCNACKKLIIPKEDGTDSYNVECLGRSYHENCYRCEVGVLQLSPEPNEHGCYPLDGKMLCKSCHLSLVSGQH